MSHSGRAGEEASAAAMERQPPEPELVGAVVEEAAIAATQPPPEEQILAGLHPMPETEMVAAQQLVEEAVAAPAMVKKHYCHQVSTPGCYSRPCFSSC